MGRNAAESPTARVGLFNRIFKKQGNCQDQQVASEVSDTSYDYFQRGPTAEETGADRRFQHQNVLAQSAKSGHRVITNAAEQPCSRYNGASSSVPAPAAAELSLHGAERTEAAAAARDSTHLGNARNNALSDPGQPQATQQLQERGEPAPVIIDGMPPPGQRSSNGSINEPGASVWLHEAFTNPHSSVSSPTPMHRSVTGMRSGGKLCASMEDMYKMIFDDGITASSSTAASPCPSGTMATRQGSCASMGSYSSCPQQTGRCSNNSVTAGSTPIVHHVSGSYDSANAGYCQLDDLVPAGLANLKVSGRHSGCSDTESGDGGFFLQHSPGYSSNGNIVPAWPEVASGKSPVAACNRGSPRYGLQQAGSSNSSLAGNTANQPPTHQLPQQQPQLKRLWQRRQAALLDGSSSGGSRPATASPSLCIGGAVWRAHSTPAGHESSLSELAAQIGTADSGTPYGSNSSRSATPMSHSFSNPDIAAGNVPPACARSLFGSVPQMDRPLGSSSWLARADSGLLDDHLSVASDDEYIREVNSENVLSSAWGPAHAKLMAFKYCDATSPLNHPGRASPFKGSPFASPRGSRDVDLLPLRAAAASGVMSCPGSPLGSNYSTSGIEDSVAMQRHRHPFGRCPNDPHACYRPSPLQLKQPHGCSDGCIQQQAGKQERHSNGSDLAATEIPGQGPEQTDGAEASELRCTCACKGLATPQLSGSLSAEAEVEGLHTAHSASSSMMGFMLPRQHAQHATTAPVGSREPSGSFLGRRPSSTLGRGGAAPAAAVSALMAGWGNATADMSSGSRGHQPSYGVRQKGSKTAAAAGVPRLALPSSDSGSSAEAGLASGTVSRSRSNSSEFSKPAGVAAAAAAVAADACSQGHHSPTSSSTPSSCALNRSRSVPMPGAVACANNSSVPSSSNTPPARTGFLNTLASCMSLPGGSIMGQLAPSYPTAAGNGLLPSLASSAELLLPPQKLTGVDSPGRRGARRQSRGFSSSSFSNPSRLSQSSAAGESTDAATTAVSNIKQAGRSSSTGSSLLLAASGSSAPELVRAALPSSLQVLVSPDQQPADPQQEQQQSEQADPQQEQQQQQQHEAQQAQSSVSPVPSTEMRHPGTGSDAVVLSAGDAGVVAASDSKVNDPAVTAFHAESLSSLAEVGSVQQDGQVDSDLDAAGSTEASDLAISWVSNGSPRAQRGSGATDSTTAQQQHAAAMPSLPEVDFIERIGRGSFGEVYRGVWCGSVVAVKVIKVRQQPPASRRRGMDAKALRSPAAALNTSVPWSADPSSRTASLCDDSAGSSSSSTVQQKLQADIMLSEAAEHEQQVAMELAQHEYESWLNANLRHPNIVQLFTSFTVVLEDRPHAALSATAPDCGWGCSGLSWNTHLVMEYCELGTMQAVLQRGVFMDPQVPTCCNALWVLATAKEICAALAYLHSMDVVHGDLKSSNVLLKAAATTAWDSRGFLAKVSDFGLSRVMDAISAANGAANGSTANSTCGDSAAASGMPLGQLPAQQHFGALTHAAPELIRGEELSKASDVYSVGVLLWELVSGQAPFYGLHPGQLLNAKLTNPTGHLLQFPDTAPAAIMSLCLNCWDGNPAQRPSMAGVVEKLNCMAVELLGEDQAVMAFPDIARAISAQRRSAAIAAATAAAQPGQWAH